MSNQKIAIFLLLTSLVISACTKGEFSNSTTMQEQITLHNLGDISQKVKNEPSFTKEEIELFANGLVRLAANKDSVVGKTVLDIIKSQKQFVRSRSLSFCENTISRVDLALNHKFHYVGFQPRDEGKQSVDVIVFEITNTSDKDIREVEGALQFYTQNNQLVKVYNLKFNKPLKPGETQRFGNPFTHNPESQRDQVIRSSKDLKAVWNPTLIEFADGTKRQLSNGENM